MGSHDPVLRIAGGDTVITTAVDSGGKDQFEKQITTPGNPQTGPFYVHDAEPGDTLAVHLDSLVPNRDTGVSRTALAANVVEPDSVRNLPQSQHISWRIDRVAGVARLAGVSSLRGRVQDLLPAAIGPGLGLPARATRLANLTISLDPMLGCFGVAPSGGQAISTATSGPYGGNMDYRGFRAGVTAYFPVFVPGALFHLGDGHAVQGDGEIVGTGIEISFDVQFTIYVLKRKSFWPRGQNADYIFTAGNARPLDQALQHATSEMSRWLEEDFELNSVDVSVLLGQCVEYDVGNVFDPAFTMICKIQKSYLKQISPEAGGVWLSQAEASAPSA